MLELVNRAKPQILHLREQGTLHPRAPLPFPGRLGRRDGDLRCRRSSAATFPIYRHPEPGTAFLPLITTIRQLLIGLAKIEGKAVPVPLQAHKSGIRTTTEETSPELFKARTFVLAVSAAMANEQVRNRFPGSP